MSQHPGNLIVETSLAGDEVIIRGQAEDLRTFARVLMRLAEAAERGESSHEHCFSSAWGGYDLAGKSTEASLRPVHHIKVYGCSSVSSVSQDGT